MTDIKATLKRLPLAAQLNAQLKAWIVERDAAAVRRRYANHVPNDASAAIRGRIGRRATERGWPRPLGGLHIFAFYSLQNWEEVLPRALSPFGEVSVYEWRSRGFDDSKPDWLLKRDDMNEELLEKFHAANRRRPVDVVVGYASGYTVADRVFTDMATAGAVTTNFCFDDKVRWPGPMLGGRYASTAAFAHAVDLNLTSDPNGISRYSAHGGIARFHAEAADPEWFKPLDIPFEYDVSFVGASYGWRPVLIGGLRRRGITVTCFGKDWPNGPIGTNDMKLVYARSRINLGCGGIGFSRKLLCLKGRDFEVPMSGAVYLTQDNPELNSVFERGQEILTYRDIDDCARIIRELLADPHRAARIRTAARARCLLDHTYRARWGGVLHALGALTED